MFSLKKLINDHEDYNSKGCHPYQSEEYQK